MAIVEMWLMALADVLVFSEHSSFATAALAFFPHKRKKARTRERARTERARTERARTERARTERARALLRRRTS